MSRYSAIRHALGFLFSLGCCVIILQVALWTKRTCTAIITCNQVATERTGLISNAILPATQHEKSSSVLYPNITARAELQQQRIRNYCSNEPDNSFSNISKLLLRFMLFDDTHKVIYTIIPKTGCTTMKTAFLLLQGHYTLDELRQVTVYHGSQLRRLRSMVHVTKEEVIYKLQNYFKFVVVRNPLERLLSGYEEKLNNKEAPHLQEGIRMKILLENRGGQPSQWLGDHPTFPEFVNYFINHTFDRLQDHFMPMVDICQPCVVKYDFFIGFKTLDDDVRALFQHLHLPEEYFFSNIKHPSQLMPKPAGDTRKRVSEQFSLLTPEQMEAVVSKLSDDLKFYYSLFPEESNMHTKINVSQDKIVV